VAAPLKTRLALVAIPALLVVSGLPDLPTAGAAAAKPRTQVLPTVRTGSIKLGRSGGWNASIDTVYGRTRNLTSIAVNARGPGHQSLQYGVHGRAAADGSIEAKLPGVGRISLRFEGTEEKTSQLINEPGCRGPDTSVERIGVFRGRIELHDEGGAIDIDRRSVPGRIYEFPGQTCRRPKRPVRPPAEPAEPFAAAIELAAGRSEDGGSLTFQAQSVPSLGGVLGEEQEPPTVNFSATFFRSRQGMTTTASTEVEGSAGDLVAAPSTGTPSEATVAPPAPFEGSAVFKLESPSVASWTGDLRVRVPIVGEVAPTDPGFWSILCRDTACTDTLPPGVRFGFLFFSSRLV
jgi:hypothetical protein